MKRRVCDRCKRVLWGRKGHGFPMFNGTAIFCADCAKAGKK